MSLKAKSLLIFFLLALCGPVYAGTPFSALTSAGTFSSATDQVLTVRNGGGVGNPDLRTNLSCSSLANSQPSCSIDTTNATNISAGTLNAARLPSPFTNATASGNTSQFALVSGSIGPGCVGADGSGNIVASSCTGGGGSGTVTLVSANGLSPLFSAAVANSTTTPTITYALTTQSPNLIYAGPVNGSASNPAFRALVSTDFPPPTATGLGGIFSLGAVSHLFINAISTTGQPSAAQPAASDLSDGTTGTTTVVLSSAPTLTNPVVGTQGASDNSTKAASTAYVTGAINTAIAGVNPAVAVVVATTAASDTSGLTYSNGVSGIGATLTGSVNTAITIDGVTLTSLNQRVLVKNDTQVPSGAFNGVYYLTQIQTAILAPILTRALDYDMPSDINNTGAIPVTSGTVNASTTWVLTSSVTTVGTDALTFTKFSINPTTIQTNTLTNGHVWVGNGSNVAADVAMSGGATITSTGAVTLGKPGASTLGGVQSFLSASSAWLNGLTVNGVFTSSRPACADLSNAAASCSTDTTVATNITTGTLPRAQLPTPNSNALGGVQSIASTASAWLNGLTSTGVFTSSRPACADLSNSGTSCTVNTGTSGATIPLLNAQNTFSSTQTFSSNLYLSSGAAWTGVFSAGYCSTSCSINIDNGPIQRLDLNSTATISLTTPTHPGRATLINGIILGSSIYSISSCNWPSGSAIKYSSALGSTDVISIMFASSKFWCMGGAGFQ